MFVSFYLPFFGGMTIFESCFSTALLRRLMSLSKWVVALRKHLACQLALLFVRSCGVKPLSLLETFR